MIINKGQLPAGLLRNALLRTSRIPVPGSDLKAYGTIEVTTYGDIFP